tara:strand:- start:2426 stop:3211 length:786 start_codon:yes stop_codon:yes gene_type:complete
MSDKSDNSNLNEKYLEELREFYILKKRYEKYKENIKKKIIDSDNSMQVKKQLLAKTKFKCINCKNEGGTIFQIDESSLKVFCGNKLSPCNIDLNISRKKFTNLKKDLINTENEINQKKREIIISKLNYIFKYIEEDKAVENFEQIKLELTELQKNYNKLFEKYLYIFDNDSKKSNLEDLVLMQHNYINEFKDILNLYYSTRENKYLKNALNYYINNIINIDEKILNSQYKYNAIEKDLDNNITYLIQDKYLQTDIELLVND